MVETDCISSKIVNLSKDISVKGVSAGSRVLAKSIQEISNRFSDLVAQLRPNPHSTSVGPSLKWSDLVDREESSMVLFLSENLMVAQSSGVNRDDKMLEQGLQAQATEVHTSFEGMGPNPDLKEQGSDVSEATLDTGDLNSNVTNQRFHYARGGYHGHGRGVPANFKGGYGMNRG